MFKKAIAYLLTAAMISMMALNIMPAAAYAAGNTYYVDAVNGNDSTGDGSSANPWKTISKASGALTSGDTCKIRSGIYRETVKPANSGVTFEPDTGANVTVSGADLLTDEWTNYSGNVYKHDVTLGMSDLYRNQVYVDGVAMNLARYPNKPVSELYDPSFSTFLKAGAGSEGSPYFSHSGKIVDASLTQPNGYWDGAAVITTDSYGWCLSGATVSSYTTGVLNLGDGNAFSLGETSHYYLVGKLAELDYPGEWFYDNTAKILYLQTPSNDDPRTHKIEVKARDLGFDLRGKQNIVIKGINLFACTVDTTDGSNITIDGINAKYLSEFYTAYDKPGGLVLGGTNNTLKNSTLSDSSGSVVNVEGENNRVINNLIQNGTYGPTLSLTMVFVQGKGHLISNNTMKNAAREVFGGNFFASEIKNNDFSFGNYYGDDTGLVYLAHGDYGGSEFHNNYFHDSVQSFSCGFYADLAVRNVLVYDNVFWNIPGSVLDNIFVNDSSDFVSIFNNTIYRNPANTLTSGKVTLHSQRDAYRDIIANNITLDGLIKDDADVGAIFSTNMKEGDPLYVNPGLSDFHLQSGSPAIDKGVVVGGITEGFTGTAPDFGAYEYGGADWTAGCDFSNPPNPVLSLTDYQYKNFVVNGGFEWPRVNLNNYDSLYGWTRTNSKTAASVWDDGTLLNARLTNKYGCRLGTGQDGIEQTVTGLKPNTTYEIRGFARTSTINQSVRLGVKAFGGDDTFVDVNQTSWQDKKFTFTTGATDTSATVYAYKSTTGGYAFVDDIMLSVAEISLPIDPKDPTPPPEPIPPYTSPVAIVDDMLQDSANWQASDGAALKVSDDSITLSGDNAAAGYYGEKYLNQDIYFNLKTNTSDSTTANGDPLASIVLRSTDPKKSVSAGNDGYQIQIKKGSVEIQGWKASTQMFTQSYDTDLIQPNQNALLKASAITTDGAVTIKLKIGNTLVAEYKDSTNLIPEEGYFGVTAPKPLAISRITTPVNMVDMLRDKANWRGKSGSKLDFAGDSLTVSGGGASAGYFGQQYKNVEFSLKFETDTTIKDCWPSIVLRSSDPLKDMWAGNDAYGIVFKKDTFELQGWKGSQNRMDTHLYENKDFLPNTLTPIRVSTVDTDEGVWIRLKVGNKIVANYVDTANINPDANYFGLIAWTPITISSPDYVPTPPVPPRNNLALNKTVQVSSTYSDQWGVNLPGDGAVDGDTTTRWAAAAYEDVAAPQWISVDMGETKNINEVKLNWTTVYSTNYKIQVSSDNTNWTDVYAASSGAGGNEDITFNATDARYVRLYSTARNDSTYGISIYEFGVYSPADQPPQPPVNFSLKRPVEVSSWYSDQWGTNLPGGNAVDGDMTTRWAAAAFTKDPQWISVDLGETKAIDHVKLNWESVYSTNYKIQISSDNTNWTDVYSTTSGDGALDDITFTAVDTRYVRMYSEPISEGSYGISLYEFEVYGPSQTQTPDTTPPVINLTGNATVNVANGAAYTDAGATVIDNRDTGLVPVVTYTKDGSPVASINTTVAGTYLVHYNATDAAGNHAAEVTRTVIVAEAVRTEVNLALNKTVTTRSNYDNTYPGSKAVDGDKTTRWAAAPYTALEQWISVDLGSTQAVNHVILNWSDPYASAYEIQVSTNGTDWTSVYSTTSGNGAVDDITFTTVNAEYVRLYPGPGDPGNYGISLNEFEVYGPSLDTTAPVITLNGDATVNVANGATYTDAGATVTDNKDTGLAATVTYTKDGNSVAEIDTKSAGTYIVHYNAKDIAGNAAVEITRTVIVAEALISQVNLALNKPVQVSSTYSDQWGTTLPGINAVDGNAATRWAAAPFTSDPQWISVDLGGIKAIDHVKLNWGNPPAASYKIQVSIDGTSWTDVYSTTTGDGAIDDISFTPSYARYVKMYAAPTSSGDYGVSLNEFEVYESAQTPAMTAAVVAAGITSVAAPLKDATSLTMPTVPEGFTIAIKSVAPTGVIETNGTITPPRQETTAAIVFTVTNTADNTSSDTISINVVVPAKTLVFYKITATSGEHGSVSPAGVTDVKEGLNVTYTFLPDKSYQIDKVIIDGTEVKVEGNSYTINDVSGDHTINVTFKKITHKITVIEGENGSITPDCDTVVEEGSDITFTFDPDRSYKIDKVILDGLEVIIDGASYTIKNVTGDHTIEITFRRGNGGKSKNN